MSATPLSRNARHASRRKTKSADDGDGADLSRTPASPPPDALPKDTTGSNLTHPGLGTARLVTANAGDHALIYDLLLAVQQGPSRDEFHASLDEPQYEPSDRLLVKIGSRIVSHVQLIRRQMKFGSIQLPIAEVAWLATLPEYASAGYAPALLAAADEQMLADGAVLATLRSTTPTWFEPEGWAVCTQEGYWSTSARDLLAQLSARRVRRSSRSRYRTRVWRHVELNALMNIYQEHTDRGYGALVRSEAYWQWLISRKAYDQIIVAIEGKDSLDYGEQGPKFVGYAVMRLGRIVECMTLPSHRRALGVLLARACREAIEHDHHTIFLHSSPADPLNKLLLDAGGTWHSTADVSGGNVMVKLLDRRELVHRLYPELHHRAKAAGLARPCEIGLGIDETPYRFVLTRRSARLVGGDPQQKGVRCSQALFTQLLVGRLDLDQALAEGQLQHAAKADVEVLRILFPRLAFWRSPLDDLRA